MPDFCRFTAPLVAVFLFSAITPQATELPTGEAFASLPIESEFAPPNVYQLVPSSTIYRGARPESQEQMNFLVNQLYVKTIIDLQGGDFETPYIGSIVAWLEPGERPEEIAQERKRGGGRRNTPR